MDEIDKDIIKALNAIGAENLAKALSAVNAPTTNDEYDGHSYIEKINGIVNNPPHSGFPDTIEETIKGIKFDTPCAPTFDEFSDAAKFDSTLKAIEHDFEIKKKAYNAKVAAILAAHKENVEAVTGGLKFDDGKIRMDLLPPKAITELGKVLTYGAKEYGDNNWQQVATKRYVAAILRHLIAWMGGDDYDAKSKLHHMSHVLCNAAFLVHKVVEYPEVEDGNKDQI